MKKTMLVLVCAWIAVVCIAADNITGNIRIDPYITHSGVGVGSTLTETLSSVFQWGGGGTIGTNGAATGMNKLAVISGSLAASGTNTYDLAGGISNNFGQSLTFARVKMMILCPSNNMTTVPQSVLIRPAPANGFASWQSTTQAAARVYAGGAWAVMAPCTNAYAVTAGTGDLLDIINESTNAATFFLYIGGE